MSASAKAASKRRRQRPSTDFESVFGATLTTPMSVKNRSNARKTPLFSGRKPKRVAASISDGGGSALHFTSPASKTSLSSSTLTGPSDGGSWRDPSKQGSVQHLWIGSECDSKEEGAMSVSRVGPTVDVSVPRHPTLQDSFMLDPWNQRAEYEHRRRQRMRVALLHALKERDGLETDIELSPVDVASPASRVWVLAKVVESNTGFALEGESAALDSDSLLLGISEEEHGSGERSGSSSSSMMKLKRVAMDLNDKLKEPSLIYHGKYALFYGLNSTGDCFCVERIVDTPMDVAFDQPSSAVLSPSLTVCVAGPLTIDGCFEGSPLEEVCKQALIRNADCLVLIGPFITEEVFDRHRESVTPNDLLNGLFEGVYKMLLRSLKERGSDHRCRAVLVPSPSDVCHLSAFPQRPFDQFDRSVPYCDTLMRFASNPCVMTVGGLKLAINGNDAVSDAVRQVTIVPKNGFDRSSKRWKLKEIARQCVSQMHLNPVFNPSVHRHLNWDYSQSAALELNEKPDVLVLPSKLSVCADPLSECDVIYHNCGPLLCGKVGRCFSLIHVSGAEERSASEMSSKYQRIQIQSVHI